MLLITPSGFFLLTVNIRIVSVGSSAITVGFDGNPDEDANGVVTGYTIYYQPIVVYLATETL